MVEPCDDYGYVITTVFVVVSDRLSTAQVLYLFTEVAHDHLVSASSPFAAGFGLLLPSFGVKVANQLLTEGSIKTTLLTKSS